MKLWQKIMRTATTIEEGAIYRRQAMARDLRKVREGKYLTTRKVSMAVKYRLFLDECGDHGLVVVNPDFPVFVLCGVIMSEEAYLMVDTKIDEIKRAFWGDKKVILHSRDIRKCDREFQVLFDPDIKKSFYEAINHVVGSSHYTIIAAAINKEAHIKQYGKLASDVYAIALSFVIERSIFYLDEQAGRDKRLHITIECRGKKEDIQLHEHFQQLCSRGTGFVPAARLKAYGVEVEFVSKSSDVNGLQLSDLIAYPVARHVLDPIRANPAFDVLAGKFYTVVP